MYTLRYRQSSENGAGGANGLGCLRAARREPRSVAHAVPRAAGRGGAPAQIAGRRRPRTARRGTRSRRRRPRRGPHHLRRSRSAPRPQRAPLPTVLNSGQRRARLRRRAAAASRSWSGPLLSAEWTCRHGPTGSRRSPQWGHQSGRVTRAAPRVTHTRTKSSRRPGSPSRRPAVARRLGDRRATHGHGRHPRCRSRTHQCPHWRDDTRATTVAASCNDREGSADGELRLRRGDHRLGVRRKCRRAACRGEGLPGRRHGVRPALEATRTSRRRSGTCRTSCGSRLRSCTGSSGSSTSTTC